MAVLLSDKAASEIKRMMQEKEASELTLLRVGVVGGGCSGYEYSMTFSEDSNELEDILSESNGVRIAVDRKSAQFMDGTTIDFQDDLLNRGFVFKNPMAVRTCGCGTSFQVGS